MKESPPSLARAMAMRSSETDCIMADTRGVFKDRGDSSPFLNLTKGVFKLTLAGTHWVEE